MRFAWLLAAGGAVAQPTALRVRIVWLGRMPRAKAVAAAPAAAPPAPVEPRDLHQDSVDRKALLNVCIRGTPGVSMCQLPQR